jgi:hypothetical protein
MKRKIRYPQIGKVVFHRPPSFHEMIIDASNELNKKDEVPKIVVQPPPSFNEARMAAYLKKLQREKAKQLKYQPKPNQTINEQAKDSAPADHL